MSAIQFALPLPPRYRMQEVLSFHGRDTHGVAEQVGAARIRKGMLQGGIATVLDIVLNETSAECTVNTDATLPLSSATHFHDAALNILGLRIDPEPFLAFTETDPLLGPLARAQPGLRIVQSASLFEALTWAIIGQQINLPFAISLRRTFILQAGRQHSSGLWCYPVAADVARLDIEALTSRKFSRAKADTLLRLARLIDDGELTLSMPDSGDIGDISNRLLAVKGIGPWTVNYALLRGYGYADCSLHGDVAIRAALQRLLGEANKPDLVRTQQILEQYRPHRSMAAAYLWASLHCVGLRCT